MTRCPACLVTLAAVLCLAALPTRAESSVSSAVSDSVSTSVGSISDSIRNSSNSSSGDEKKVAEGEYRVVDVAPAPERPGQLRVRLQALDDHATDGEFVLVLPQAAAERGGVAQGRVVAARQRPYGVEFAAGEPRQAFFLVLEDAWYRELQTRAVQL